MKKLILFIVIITLLFACSFVSDFEKLEVVKKKHPNTNIYIVNSETYIVIGADNIPIYVTVSEMHGTYQYSVKLKKVIGFDTKPKKKVDKK